MHETLFKLIKKKPTQIGAAMFKASLLHFSAMNLLQYSQAHNISIIDNDNSKTRQ